MQSDRQAIWPTFPIRWRHLLDCAGHESWVLSVACHPDGTAFATGSSDSKVKLWDLQTRACVQTIADHTDQVRGLPAEPFFAVTPCRLLLLVGHQ